MTDIAVGVNLTHPLSDIADGENLTQPLSDIASDRADGVN